MRHVFLANPAAGKGRFLKSFLPRLKRTAEELGIVYEIYETRCVGDCENYVRQCCQEAAAKEKKDGIRFYAIGGDGTLNEAVNGAFGYSFAEVTVIPCGTGNDFVRNFSQPESFLDIGRQIRGSGVPVDLIQYNGRYAVNMINIGADCDVVIEAGKMRKHPIFSGSLAYLAGAVKVLSGKLGIRMAVNTPEETLWREELILIAIANGKFCGGGFKGVPKALVNDGLMDVSIAKMMPKIRFLTVFPRYKKGTHLDRQKDAELFQYIQCRQLTMNPEQPMEASVDGEIVRLEKTTFTIVRHGIRFSVPETQKG